MNTSFHNRLYPFVCFLRLYSTRYFYVITSNTNQCIDLIISPSKLHLDDYRLYIFCLLEMAIKWNVTELQVEFLS